MKSFLKLSIAAVAIGVLLSGNAFAGPVETGSDVKLTVSGWIGVNAHYTQMEEPLVATDEGVEVGDAPPATLEVADRANLNVTAAYENITYYWQYWQQDGCLNGCGDELFGRISWKPTAGLTIDAGVIEDPYWSELPIDWETFVGPNAVASNGVGAVAFPEHTTGVDIDYDAGVVRVGVLLSASAQASGGRGGTINGATDALSEEDTNFPKSPANTPQSGSQVNSYTFHVVYPSEMVWVSLLYVMENSESLVADEEGEKSWESFSDSAIRIMARVNLGVGKLKLGYWTASGDTYDAQDDNFKGDDPDADGIDAPTDIAVAYHHNIGESMAFVEYEIHGNGTIDDKGEAADATYMRVGYRMPIATNSSMQFEYEIQDLGYSQRSAPGVAWLVSY
jgi:hypothetical protein